MLRLLIAAIATVGLSSSTCQAQHFTADPIVVDMIDPGPAYSFHYAYADIKLKKVPAGLHVLRFINRADLDMDVIVPISIPGTPPLPPWSDWPFAGTGMQSHEILILNYERADAMFMVEFLDIFGRRLDTATVICRDRNR